MPELHQDHQLVRSHGIDMWPGLVASAAVAFVALIWRCRYAQVAMAKGYALGEIKDASREYQERALKVCKHIF